MSGIYIKGMEMPKNCVDCRFHKSIYCTLTDICTNTAQGCPLISVPDHGRLIDADALKEEWRNGFHRKIVDALMEDAPTIIPADKDGAE